MFTKKGDNEAKAVSVLIIIIALFMVLYILFIPPEDREQLLNPNGTVEDTTSTTVGSLELLSESPGMLSPEKQQLNEHNLMPVNLFIKNEPQTENLAQSLVVSKALFSDTTPKVYFNINTKDLKKASLYFSISGPTSGTLRIDLNGNQFYSEKLTPGVKIIDLPLGFLVKTGNVLTFSVSSPGVAFWATNEYNLKDIGIKEDFELINSKEQRNLDVPQVEKDSIESAKLEYFQVCNMQLPTSTTALKIYLNNNPMPISSTRIKCNSMKNSFDIDADLLRAGQNTLSFVLEEAGDFSLNEVALITESKETDFPSYVFSLSSNQYKDIKSGAKTIELTMDLGAKKVAKSARLSVNSGDIFMNTKDSSFTYNLRDYVEEGSNHLRIIPTNDFTMNSLKVVLK